MNSLQFPYPDPSVCSIVTSVSKACICIANGTAEKVLVQHLHSYNLIDGMYTIRDLFRRYDVAKALYCPSSKNFVSMCRNGLEKQISVTKVELDKDRFIEWAQDIQYAYGSGELTFEDEIEEKLFRKKMKLIDPKKMSLDVEAMLMLFPYLINKKFSTGEQVKPSGIYI